MTFATKLTVTAGATLLSISSVFSAPKPSADPKPVPVELVAVANAVGDLAQPAGMPNFSDSSLRVTFAGIDPRKPTNGTPFANCEEPICEAPATPDYVPNQNVPADPSSAPGANQPTASCFAGCGQPLAPGSELTESVIAPARTPGGVPYATGLAAPKPESPSLSVATIPSVDRPSSPAFAAAPKAS